MSDTAFISAARRLAVRDPYRTEADLQADLYVLLTSGRLSLEATQVARLEVQLGDGTRRRLDVEVGHCVIEVKKDLRKPGVLKEAQVQLEGYVETQSQRLSTRYVGVLTDGTEWRLFHLRRQHLEEVASLELSGSESDPERLQSWLESVLATQEAVSPVPTEIHRRLGAESPSHQLDHASLSALYEISRDVPEVRLKRDLWAKLLRTAFGTAFTNDEQLFIDHTLLVLTAEIIAHAVAGFDISPTGHITPAALARGTAFESAQIRGVVEADFFDWVLHAPGGAEFISELARRISIFDWSRVEHDVLKVLYESVIESEARAKLGEYYTPDWLAQRMVADTISEPLTMRALDPACGSGTFLFHAIRAYLDACAANNIDNASAVKGVTRQILGMDIHPVAVTLARVTYLLAIGRERLASDDRGPISIPVYLGDSLQWEQRRDLLSTEGQITISTSGDDLLGSGGGTLFADDLVFPRSVLGDAGDFDRLVGLMAEKAQDDSARGSREVIAPILRRLGVLDADHEQLTQTFDVMRRLHRTGRDHIWGYYVRNLIRPIWLSEAQHRVDVLIGNPPWLRYSKMTSAMQQRYKLLAGERGLLAGALGASGRDLSTLFVTRSVELYLKDSGRFSFVMPHGTLTRRPHSGFRSGRWSSKATGPLAVAFDEAWDLSKVNTGFPMVSCVIHGQRSVQARGIPVQVLAWSGRLPVSDVAWDTASPRLTTTPVKLGVHDADVLPPASVYKRRFRQGAVLAPRALLFASLQEAGPLGAGSGMAHVVSRRTRNEKPPWKTVASLSASVEKAFVRPVHLGETLLPFRMRSPLRAVLPITASGILSTESIEDHAGLSSWWNEAERTWERHKSSADSSALLDRIDYHGQLSAQIPAARHRVAYTASGNTLAAARIEDPDAIIEHKLYWAAASGIGEARYLVAILNSSLVLERVKPLQALGLFGPRDFDKNVFAVPIPSFDGHNPYHQELVQLCARAEALVESLVLDETEDFKRSRLLVRQELLRKGLSDDLDQIVGRIIPPLDPSFPEPRRQGGLT